MAHDRLDGPKSSQLGLRTVCRIVEKAVREESGIEMKLSHETVRARLKGTHIYFYKPQTDPEPFIGTQPLTEFNHAKRWLLPEEEEVILEFALESASRGWPLEKERIKAHVDKICSARFGGGFPGKGVGLNWVDRFLKRHANRIRTYRAYPLEALRGKAVNEYTHRNYFNILKCILSTGDDGEPLLPENIYGSDETAFRTGEGSSNRKVVGPAGKRIQHQQKTGNRENITVMVTICADGSSPVPPAVIFKGSKYLVKWRQDNPANALSV